MDIEKVRHALDLARDFHGGGSKMRAALDEAIAELGAQNHTDALAQQAGMRMVAINFKQEFVDLIDGGAKTRTIRQVRKSGNPKPGEVIQLYTGMRTKKCEKIRDVTCTRVRPVQIDHIGIVLDGKPLFAGDAPAYLGGPDADQYDGDFARADGFDTFSDMVEFFEKQYGLPFKGQLIEWSLSIPLHK